RLSSFPVSSPPPRPFLFFFSLSQRPPRSTLFPYTTLFRSLPIDFLLGLALGVALGVGFLALRVVVGLISAGGVILGSTHDRPNRPAITTEPNRNDRLASVRVNKGVRNAGDGHVLSSRESLR